MVVKIEEIREGGLELTDPVKLELLTSALAGSGPDTGFRPAGPAPGTVKLIKVGSDVLVTVDGPEAKGEIVLVGFSKSLGTGDFYFV